MISRHLHLFHLYQCCVGDVCYDNFWEAFLTNLRYKYHSCFIYFVYLCLKQMIGMKRQHSLFVLVSAFILCSACTSRYVLTDIKSEKILIDKRFDATTDNEAIAFLMPYKQRIDSLMSPVLGQAASSLSPGRPESKLSNLLADILIWGAKPYQEKIDFSIYNMGGIRASFAKGDVTIGDVVEVAPFENKICFVTLTGDKVLELFGQIAHRGGEGVSKEVRMIISKDGQLKDVTLNGKEIEPRTSYRIATIDYLVQGNDGLTAFKDGIGLVAPASKESNVRDIIMDYFKECSKSGKQVDARIEGRIIVE